MSHISHIDPAQITIRSARESDVRAIRRVAGRDTEALPAEPLLVAEVDGDVRAAISLADGSTVADPFHRTTELVEMLRIRAAGAGTEPRRSGLALLLSRGRLASQASRGGQPCPDPVVSSS